MRQYLYSLATDKRNDILSNIIKLFLYILSLIYGFVLGLINFLYWIKILKRHKLNCKVISIGNITLGGTGKTPTVAFLANYLRKKGQAVGILIRGYASRGSKSNNIADYKTVGDEAAMLMRRLRGIVVIAGKNRVRNGKEAVLKYGFDTLILDDGFQHHRLHRDLEIVLVDSLSSFGNRHILPRGILREPLRSLKRADIFILTKADTVENTSDLEQFLMDFYPGRLILEAIHKPVSLEPFGLEKLKEPMGNMALSELKDRSICALSSIGDPGYFEGVLKRLGSEIDLSFRFPDHYEYKRSDLQKIYIACQRQGITTIITTQKDAVRLEDVADQVLSLRINIFILNIEIQIKNEKAFFKRVDSLYFD